MVQHDVFDWWSGIIIPVIGNTITLLVSAISLFIALAALRIARDQNRRELVARRDATRFAFDDWIASEGPLPFGVDLDPSEAEVRARNTADRQAIRAIESTDLPHGHEFMRAISSNFSSARRSEDPLGDVVTVMIHARWAVQDWLDDPESALRYIESSKRTPFPRTSEDEQD